MLRRTMLTLILLSFVSAFSIAVNSSSRHLAGIEMPEHPIFNAISSSTNDGCTLSISNNPKSPPKSEIRYEESPPKSLKLHLNHRSKARLSIFESTARDFIRIQALHRRILEKTKQHTNFPSPKTSKKSDSPAEPPEPYETGQLTATLESGVSLGSGEYFMDVLIGTPPRRFSLIVDTGSDLNWLQCYPCIDCFEQVGPFYNPNSSLSYRNISCRDPRCSLVSSPDTVKPCDSQNQTCTYFYWYGDSSNTTGDFAMETFTVNLTTQFGMTEFKQVENVMFGCGHWNRGLFHGAAGLLGLGRGPLSFSSQLRSIYGHSFSYCFVDRNSNTSVSSKLIFGDDSSHSQLNFTSLEKPSYSESDNPVDTFYYLKIKSIMVGGEALDIPTEAWDLTVDGSGGTIIDSGTTLSYFAEPGYKMIVDAFIRKVKKYPQVKDFLVLSPCYNVSGFESPELDIPSFRIGFEDGAVWDFPVENYFIRLPDDVMCLAILGSRRKSLSIIGNYQQQNFHILYDTKRSRLGFAPTNCADL